MRLNTFSAAIVALFIFSAGVINDAFAQNTDNERRFTLSFNAGSTITNDVFRLGPAGSVEIDNENKLAFGLSAMYTLTPSFALEFMVQYHQFENASPLQFASFRNVSGVRTLDERFPADFESSVIDFSLRTNYNLNQILGLNRISPNVAPYVTLGAGLQYFDFERTENRAAGVVVEEDTGLQLVAILGAGFNFRITNTIDLFAQYDFRVTPDNAIARTLRRNDDISKRTITYGTLFGGLRFHFGQREARHMSWRPAPMDLYEDDFNRLMALHTRMDDLERQLATQGDDMSALEARTTALEGRADDHEGRISELERQFAEMQQTMRDRERERETRATVDANGLTQELPDGHYVQVFAGLTMDQAQSVRQTMIRELQGVLDNPAQMVLITKRRQFYEVRVGVFNRFPETANVLRTSQGVFSDAFVVTFPRPAHLSTQYQDIRRVD